MVKKKTMKIIVPVHDRLTKHGKKGETYSDIISRALDALDKIEAIRKIQKR